MLGMDFKDLILYIPITLFTITINVYAQCWASSKLGDPTPENEGRMTLNPFVHLDPIGTILMVLTGFGWTRPIAINPMYYKDRKKGIALVALAGPLANFIVAFISIILFYTLNLIQLKSGIAGNLIDSLYYLFRLFVFRSLVFAVFQLIPIPPLAGSRIIGMFLSDRLYYKMLEIERYSLLIILVLSVTGIFSRILSVGVYAVLGLMEKAVSFIFGLFTLI